MALARANGLDVLDERRPACRCAAWDGSGGRKGTNGQKDAPSSKARGISNNNGGTLQFTNGKALRLS
jgi:hypothetical protein